MNPFFSSELGVLEYCNPDRIGSFIHTWSKVGIQSLLTWRIKTFKKALTFSWNLSLHKKTRSCFELLNFPFLGLGWFCEQQKRSQGFAKENFKATSCKTHLVLFKQLAFLAAPVKSKQGKLLSFFVVVVVLFCNLWGFFFGLVLSRLNKAHPLWKGVAGCRWDKVACDYMGCLSIEGQHTWRSGPFSAHIQGKERKWSPLRRIVKPGVK